MRNIQRSISSLAAAALMIGQAWAADQPQWGTAWSRNMVSAEKQLAEEFDPATGKNIRWVADLGTETHGTPVVASGRVYIGTNNANPRDLKHQGDRGVLMCLDEKDGHLLWQLVTPKRDEDKYFDWPNTGMSSPVTVEGDHVYVVTNRGEVVCLDANGMSNGNDGPFKDESDYLTPHDQATVTPGPLDGDILWKLDLPAEAGIWPHDGAHSSILIHGDYLYLNSGTGVDNTHKLIRTPEAPSLIVIDKKTGKLVARDDEHIAPDIFHCTWSSPALIEVQGRPLIIFCGGNGVIYAFDPVPPGASRSEMFKLKKVWQFDFDPGAPKQDIHQYLQNRLEGPSDIYGMPVFHEGRLYVCGGGDVFWGKNEAWLRCIDPSGEGDITSKGLVWSYTLNKHTMSTAAVHNGLVYVTDTQNILHCVDSATGLGVWTHEMNGSFWASPMVADGKVYVGTRKGNFSVLAAGREKKVLSNLELKSPISATTTAANGTVYVATMKQLYAITPAGPVSK